MSFQAYLALQIAYARSLRRHLHLRDIEDAMMLWATKGYSRQFAERYRSTVIDF